jgi:hypothetical protein
MGGVYCENCDIAPLLPGKDDSEAIVQFSLALRAANSTPLGMMPYAVDPQAADRLWALSGQLLS